MKAYEAIVSTTVYYSVLILANSEEEAVEISQNMDLDDTFCEETCRGGTELREIKPDSMEDFGLPILKQNNEGYEVIE